MRALLAVALVLPAVIATTMALFVLRLSPSSSLDQPTPRRTQTQAANSSLGWRRLFSSAFWGSTPWPYNTDSDADKSIGYRGYYHHISRNDRDEAHEDGIGREAAAATDAADEDVQDYRHYMGKVASTSDASDAPALDSIATSFPDTTNRHLATSSDRHNVAVWAHKDIYDPLIYSYDNHTFTAHRTTDSSSDQVGQWRHIRGATKADGSETIIVGISKDEKWVRGMLLQESGGATAWEQIVPGTGTGKTGVLATLGTNQYAAVDVQYESNSQDALLVWST